MLAGFVAGLPFVAAPRPSLAAAVLVSAVAAALDALLLWRGRPQPPSVRRQVPVEWSGLFAPPVVALLYGARLGVGPLTILPTWLWWGAFALGAWHGPLPSAVTGLAFALARSLSVLGLGWWVRADAPARMSRLRAGERAAAWLLLMLSAAWAVTVSTA